MGNTDNTARFKKEMIFLIKTLLPEKLYGKKQKRVNG